MVLHNSSMCQRRKSAHPFFLACCGRADDTLCTRAVSKRSFNFVFHCILSWLRRRLRKLRNVALNGIWHHRVGPYSIYHKRLSLPERRCRHYVKHRRSKQQCDSLKGGGTQYVMYFNMRCVVPRSKMYAWTDTSSKKIKTQHTCAVSDASWSTMDVTSCVKCVRRQVKATANNEMACEKSRPMYTLPQ